MPKEVLFEIIKNGLYIELAVILLMYLFNWVIQIKLGLRLIGNDLRVLKLLPWAFGISLFCLLGKLVLPMLLFTITAVVLFSLILKLITRTFSHKAILAAIFVEVLNVLGVIIIGQSTVAFSNKNLAKLLLLSPGGVIFGTIIETIFPAITLFICSLYNISLLTSKKRMSKSEFFGVLLFVSMFLGIYNLTVIFLALEKYVPASSFILKITVIQFLIIGGMVGFAFSSHVFAVKEREDERRLFENREQTLISEHQKLQTEKTEQEENFKLEKDELIQQNQELIQENERLKEDNVDPQEFATYSENMRAFHLRLEKYLSRVVDPQELTGINFESISDSELTPTEKNVLRLVGKCYTNKKIAEVLRVKEDTVKKSVSKILSKLDLENRTMLALYAQILVKKESTAKDKA